MSTGYVEGATIVVTATYRVNNAGTDPDEATIRVRAPGGTVTVYDEGDMTNPADGVWSVAFVATEAGTYWVRAEGTGAAAGTEEAPIFVGKSKVV